MKRSDNDAKETAVATILAAAEKFPSAMISRDEVGNFTGGALSPRYLANLDSVGKGPQGAFKLGRKQLYPVSSLVSWLVARIEV